MFVAQGIVKSLHQFPPKLITAFNWNYTKRLKIKQQCKDIMGRGVAGGVG